MPRPILIRSWLQTIKVMLNWFSDNSEKTHTTIQALVIGETIKTIQINHNNRTEWLQKSLLSMEQNDGDNFTIIIPHWLYIRKFTQLKRVHRKKQNYYSTL